MERHRIYNRMNMTENSVRQTRVTAMRTPHEEEGRRELTAGRLIEAQRKRIDVV